MLAFFVLCESLCFSGGHGTGASWRGRLWVTNLVRRGGDRNFKLAGLVMLCLPLGGPDGVMVVKWSVMIVG